MPSKVFIPPLRQFCTVYHAANLISLLSYAVLRVYYLGGSLEKPSDFLGAVGITREGEILLLAVLLLIPQWRRCETLGQFLDYAFLYGKIAVIVLLGRMDAKLAARFVAVQLFVWFIPVPSYDVRSRIEELTPAELFERVAWRDDTLRPNGPSDQSSEEEEEEEESQGSSGRARRRRRGRHAAGARPAGKGVEEEKVSWLIVVTAAWSTKCRHLTPLVANLSMRFGTDRMRFGAIDVARWPQVAKPLSIDTSTTSLSIPSLLLFENGKLVRRLPQVEPSTGVATQMVRFSGEGLIQYFELQQRMDDE